MASHTSGSYCICAIGFPVMIMALYRKRSFCSPIMITSLLIVLQDGPGKDGHLVSVMC